MPINSTFAAASGRGYGQILYKLPPVPYTPGTTGIWTMNATAATRLMNFASEVVSAGGNLTYPAEIFSAMSNSTTMIAASSNSIPRSSKYTFSNGTSVAGGNFTAVVRQGATSNNVTGLIMLDGSPYTATNKYTYATDTSAVATNTTASFIYPSFSTLNIAYMANDSITCKYVYSANTVSNGTSLSANNAWQGGSCGNATFAVIGTGSTVVKYAYSNDAVSAATVLGVASATATACGNDNFGIFGNSATSKYTWVNDVVAASTNLGTTNSRPCASNGTTGVNI